MLTWFDGNLELLAVHSMLIGCFARDTILQDGRCGFKRDSAYHLIPQYCYWLNTRVKTFLVHNESRFESNKTCQHTFTHLFARGCPGELWRGITESRAVESDRSSLLGNGNIHWSINLRFTFENTLWKRERAREKQFYQWPHLVSVEEDVTLNSN